MVDANAGVAFAKEWIEAWSTHDLDHILSHDASDIVLLSPRTTCSCPHTPAT